MSSARPLRVALVAASSARRDDSTTGTTRHASSARATPWTCATCVKAGFRESLLFARADETLACARGHARDRARSGYVHLCSSSKVRGDSRGQLRARARFLGRGRYADVSAAVAEEVLRRIEDDVDDVGDASIANGDGSSGELKTVGDDLDACSGAEGGSRATPSTPRARRLAKKRRPREVKSGHHERPITSQDTDGVRTTVTPSRALRVGDFGCGEGYYADVVRAMARDGGAVNLELLAMDASKDACDFTARRLGRDVHVAVVDCSRSLPLEDASLDVAMSVFAPRSPIELARVLRPGGRVVVARANSDHMSELREVRGDGVVVLGVEKDKGERVDSAMRDAGFEIESEREIRQTMSLSEDDVVDLIFMGPSGHHAESEDAVRRAVGGVTREVTKSVVVTVYALPK